MPVPIAEAPSPRSTASVSAEDLDMREARLTTSIEEARLRIRDMNRELEDIRVARELSAPIVYPLPLPQAFDWLLDDSTGRLLHGIIQR